MRAESAKNGQRGMATIRTVPVVLVTVSRCFRWCGETGKRKRTRQGRGKPHCTACGSHTQQRSSHKDCPFHKSCAHKSVEEVIGDSESGDYVADGGSADSEEIDSDSCICGAVGKAHKRGCPLSYRNCLSGRTLFPAPGNTGDPSTQGPEIVTPVTSKDVRPKMIVHAQQKDGC